MSATTSTAAPASGPTPAQLQALGAALTVVINTPSPAQLQAIGDAVVAVVTAMLPDISTGVQSASVGVSELADDPTPTPTTRIPAAPDGSDAFVDTLSLAEMQAFMEPGIVAKAVAAMKGFDLAEAQKIVADLTQPPAAPTA